MIEINKIYNMNCLDGFELIDDNYIDLIVTSPPYNMKGNSLGYHPNSSINDKYYNTYVDNISDIEYYSFLKKVISNCLRVSRYVFWNMQMLTNNKNTFLNLIHDFSINLKDIFIWEKQAVSQIVSGKLAKGFEFILLLGKDNSTTFKYNNFPINRYVPNIQTWYVKKSFLNHHATFPIELPRYFIKNFTKDNDVILDPFMGLGTTALASLELHRKFIGFEIDNEYCKIANERINDYKKQIKFG